MSTTVVVSKLPNCDFCKEDLDKDVPANFDGRTIFGMWANMCVTHFLRYGTGLGTGVGQILIPLKGTDIETD